MRSGIRDASSLCIFSKPCKLHRHQQLAPDRIFWDVYFLSLCLLPASAHHTTARGRFLILIPEQMLQRFGPCTII